MATRRWMALSFVCYALLVVVALALLGFFALDTWAADLLFTVVFASFATLTQGVVGRCFDRSRPRALLVGGLAAWGLLIGTAWLFTFGPVGTRSDAYYGRQAAAEYAAWLRHHGRGGAVVGGCRPVWTGLEMYGPPGYFSCVVDSSPHCLLRYEGFDDLGAMSAGQCSYLAND